MTNLLIYYNFSRYTTFGYFSNMLVIWELHSHNVCLCRTSLHSNSWWTLCGWVGSAIQLIKIPLYLHTRAHMDSQRTKNIYTPESVLSKEKLFYCESVFLSCDWSECTKYMKHFTCDPNMTVVSPFSASKWSRCIKEIHKLLLWHISKYFVLSELHMLVIHHIITVFN